MMQAVRREGTAGQLRAALLILVVLGIVGTAGMLAYHRHWDGAWQLVPWGILGALGVATAALLTSVQRTILWLARAVAVITIIATMFGLWQHFDENYATAALDGRYSDRWGTMSTGARLWEVTNGAVGHVPVSAAAILVPVALALWAATIGIGEASTQGVPDRLRER